MTLPTRRVANAYYSRHPLRLHVVFDGIVCVPGKIGCVKDRPLTLTDPTACDLPINYELHCSNPEGTSTDPVEILRSFQLYLRIADDLYLVPRKYKHVATVVSAAANVRLTVVSPPDSVTWPAPAAANDDDLFAEEPGICQLWGYIDPSFSADSTRTMWPGVENYYVIARTGLRSFVWWVVKIERRGDQVLPMREWKMFPIFQSALDCLRASMSRLRPNHVPTAFASVRASLS